MRNIAEEQRPVRFSDVLGQKVPVKILKGFGRSGNYAPVYIFEGLKGSGKTTDARILAKAVNCLNRTADGEPCCECENCRKIAAGESPDVIEIDAASNNSVSDARRIVEEARYKPLELRKKVYILDEAHRMSNEAFDALLKLLEEPPEWCMFILCTTEKAKLRGTVVSRSICLNFKAISEKEMVERLIGVADGYGATLTKGGAEVMCRHSGGSMRDAYMALSICLEESAEITAESAAEALGIDPITTVFDLIKALSERNVKELCRLSKHYFETGKMLDRIVLDAIRTLSDIILYHEGAYRLGEKSPEYEKFLTSVPVSKEKAILLSLKLMELKRNSLSEVSEQALFATMLVQVAYLGEGTQEDLSNEVTMLKAEVDRMSSEIRSLKELVGRQPVSNACVAATVDTDATLEKTEEAEEFIPVDTDATPEQEDAVPEYDPYGHDDEEMEENTMEAAEPEECHESSPEGYTESAYGDFSDDGWYAEELPDPVDTGSFSAMHDAIMKKASEETEKPVSEPVKEQKNSGDHDTVYDILAQMFDASDVDEISGLETEPEETADCRAKFEALLKADDRLNHLVSKPGIEVTYTPDGAVIKCSGPAYAIFTAKLSHYPWIRIERP